MSALLFVYGTLRPDLAAAELRAPLAALGWRGAASVAGRLYDLGAYPGAVLDPDAPTRIHGELALVPDDPELWALLDRYEGFEPGAPAASLFRRVRCRALRADGGALEVWIYEYGRQPGTSPLVPGGCYPQAAPRRRGAQRGAAERRPGPERER